MATPAISAIGMLRSGSRISPETMFRSFQPSYAQSAATNAAINPAIPPAAPEYVPAKFRHVPEAYVKPMNTIPRMIPIFSTVNTS